MPVRSLSSPVIRWPDAEEVVTAVRQWAQETAARHPDVVRIGYFGSYASGDWSVGSDVDLIIIVSGEDRPFIERSRDWDTLDLPVPADVLVYTEEEWASMRQRRQAITREIINWVYRRSDDRPCR